MSSTKELYEYKQKIVTALVNSGQIVEAIGAIDGDGNHLEAAELPYTHIFPFGYIPLTIDEVGCFISIEVSVPGLSVKNDLFKNVNVTIMVICHQDMMQTSYGATRTDYIAALIEDLFHENDANKMGTSQMKLKSNVEGYVDIAHRCRTLRFTTTDMAAKLCDSGATLTIEG